MNERIKELAEQAGIEWKQQPPHFTNTSNPIDFPVSANRDLEKFAELIVRECARVYWNIDDGEIHGEYVKALKEHFGIEK